MTDRKAIVVAWLEEVQTPATPDWSGRDLGRLPKLTKVMVPRTAIWLNSGTDEDVTKALAYSETIEHPIRAVYSLPLPCKDPLGIAKSRIAKSAPTGVEVRCG